MYRKNCLSHIKKIYYFNLINIFQMKPVVFKPKSHKTTWDVVEIRENLTVLELANLLQKDVGVY